MATDEDVKQEGTKKKAPVKKETKSKAPVKKETKSKAPARSPVKKETKSKAPARSPVKKETKSKAPARSPVKKETKAKAPAKEDQKEPKSKRESRKKIKPELSDEMRQALEKRSERRSSQPAFKRGEWFRYKKLGKSWRRPRGVTNKTRRNRRYRPPKVRIGFGKPSEVRGLHPSGFREVLVHNVHDMESIDPKVQAARIGSKVGTKKRAVLIENADKKGIRVLNRGVL